MISTPREIRLGRHLALVVALGSTSNYSLCRIEISGPVRAELREYAERALERLRAMTGVGYSPDRQPDEGEYMVVLPQDGVADRALVDEIRDVRGLMEVAASDLRKEPIAFWALLFNDAPRTGTILIRKHNPTRGLREGRLITVLQEDLRRIQDPILVLDDGFDPVISNDDAILIQNAAVFEALFVDTPGIRATVETWVANLERHLPFAPGHAELLRARCLTDFRIRRRLMAIEQRGHLRGKSVVDVSRMIKHLGLQDERFISNGRLIFDDPFRLMKLLNEDLYRGEISGQSFEVDRKAPMN